MEDKELNRIFSKNLLYWLDRRGKTQADLYKKMKVSSAVVSDWCNEKKMPRLDKMVVIVSWLSIELSDLLEDKQKNHSSIDDKLQELIECYKNLTEQGKVLLLEQAHMYLRHYADTGEKGASQSVG